MTAQETLAYRQAWKAYELSGHNIDKLSAADRAALRSDPTTARNMDNRPAQITARPKAAEISPTELADEVAIAIHAEQSSNESDALSRLFHKHRKSELITRTITEGLFSWLLVDMQRLHKRVKELEAAPSKSIAYQGTYDATRRYAIGDVVTDHGSAWIAKVPTAARPGFGTSGSRDWQLFVKKGSDGRDGKDAI